jgi:hypothetical protein
VNGPGPGVGVPSHLSDGQAYLLARAMHQVALARWRQAGGVWPVGGGPTQPELYASVRAARQRVAEIADRCMPANPAELLRRVDAGDPRAVDEAIDWLETDVFVLYSGYLKQRLLRRLRRVPLSGEQRTRLQLLVLAICGRGRRQEFREICRLAVRLDDEDFRVCLGFTAGSHPGPVQRTATHAAARILAALESHGSHP